MSFERGLQQHHLCIWAPPIDFGCCRGPQPPAGEQVAGLPLRDPDLNACFSHDHVFTKCLSSCATASRSCSMVGSAVAAILSKPSVWGLER